jgi:hypothetical protein
MNDIISKFNLYELFRILLPGSYVTMSIYESNKKYFSLEALSTPEIVLISFLSALVLGTIIYSADFCRLFKSIIRNLPTNLLEKNHQIEFPNGKHRENEHKYYSWYENASINSKIKTELQSGLYHMSINIAFVSFISLVLSLFSKMNLSYLQFSYALFIASGLSAIIIVKCRLSHQWKRNYWEYLEDNDLPNPNSRE